ncbi:hypothetical protein DFH09DRAFT_935321 [Mycena vulgaris]|nr:hypothetical protein DFH09DRAFT_935321 [Mycena vulgaris]
MAAFPQSEFEGPELFEGIPIVRLHNSAADVQVFLRAIFDSSFFMPPPERSDIHVVLGIVRLAHKYDMEYLFRRALQHLTHTYPVHLDGLINGSPLLDHLCPTEAHLEAITVATEVGAL